MPAPSHNSDLHIAGLGYYEWQRVKYSEGEPCFPVHSRDRRTGQGRRSRRRPPAAPRADCSSRSWAGATGTPPGTSGSWGLCVHKNKCRHSAIKPVKEKCKWSKFHCNMDIITIDVPVVYMEGRGRALSLPSLDVCTEQFRNQQRYEKCVRYALRYIKKLVSSPITFHNVPYRKLPIISVSREKKSSWK